MRSKLAFPLRLTRTDRAYFGSGLQLGLAALTLVLAGPTIAAETYTMDSAHSTPEFQFTHLGVTTQTGRFDRVKGVVVLDLKAHRGSVTYEVESASLNMGFGTETPSSPGYNLFEVKKFPKISFKSKKLIFNDNDEVIAAEGQLSLLGISKSLTVTVNRFKCSISPMFKRKMCTGDITATIKRSEFGMVRYIPGISDEINVSVPVEAYKN